MGLEGNFVGKFWVSGHIYIYIYIHTHMYMAVGPFAAANSAIVFVMFPNFIVANAKIEMSQICSVAPGQSKGPQTGLRLPSQALLSKKNWDCNLRPFSWLIWVLMLKRWPF